MGLKAKAPRAKPEIVLATEIRFDRGEMRLEDRSLTDEKGRVIGRAKGDRRAYLTKHLKRREIDGRQCRAGERYAADYEHSQAGVPSALDPTRMESRGGGARGLPPLSGDPLAAIMLRQASVAIGRMLAEIVVWVAVEGRTAGAWAEHLGKPARDGLPCLRLALDALARHYGLYKRD